MRIVKPTAETIVLGGRSLAKIIGILDAIPAHSKLEFVSSQDGLHRSFQKKWHRTLKLNVTTQIMSCHTTSLSSEARGRGKTWEFSFSHSIMPTGIFANVVGHLISEKSLEQDARHILYANSPDWDVSQDLDMFDARKADRSISADSGAPGTRRPVHPQGPNSLYDTLGGNGEDRMYVGDGIYIGPDGKLD